MTLHNIFGITGPFGSGKTLYALQQGIRMAERFRKPLVTNFPVDVPSVRAYARMCYGPKSWVAGCCRFVQIEVMDDLMLLWKYRDSVVVFDEAGVFSNSRAWASMPREFLKNMFQVRHLNIHLLVVFQFYEQVDKQLRLVIQEWVRCKSFGYYDNRLQMPRIVVRLAYHYNPAKFMRLMGDSQAASNIIMPWFWASFVYWRVLPFNQGICVVKNFLRDLVIIATTLAQKPVILPKAHSREGLLFNAYSSKRVVGGDRKYQKRFQVIEYLEPAGGGTLAHRRASAVGGVPSA